MIGPAMARPGAWLALIPLAVALAVLASIYLEAKP
jgi:hypothetical protein